MTGRKIYRRGISIFHENVSLAPIGCKISSRFGDEVCCRIVLPLTFELYIDDVTRDFPARTIDRAGVAVHSSYHFLELCGKCILITRVV